VARAAKTAKDIGSEALAEIRAHERECLVRYEHINQRLDEGSAKFKRMELLLWGVYPFIVGTIIAAKLL
jgi:hypothetical protein